MDAHVSSVSLKSIFRSEVISFTLLYIIVAPRQLIKGARDLFLEFDRSLQLGSYGPGFSILLSLELKLFQ